MNDHKLADALDVAVERVFAGGEPSAADREIAALTVVAAALRDLPRPEFRDGLRRRLIATAPETSVQEAIALPPGAREGLHTVTPYLIAGQAAELIDFVKEVFGAREHFRATGPAGGIHCELSIGGSAVIIGGGAGLAHAASPAALHLYVPDADAVYARAMAAGATSLYRPVDQPYGAREGGVADPYGNRWYIGTFQGPAHIPAGLRAVTPSLHPVGADRAIEFLERAFAGRIVDREDSPSGTVTHACVRIGDSVVELGEAHGPFTPMATTLSLQVRDADALYRHGLAAGAVSHSEPSDQPYGARVASLRDPFGHIWYLSTPISGHSR